MGQSDEAWSEVVEQAKKLGSLVVHHYQAQDGEGGAEPASRDEVKDALQTLGESINAALGTVGDAIRDPEVKEEARQTAGAFFTALGRTFAELGDDISVHREREDPPNAPSPENAARPDTPQETE